LKYLGIELKKPRIGVFDFTCCEGCELQLANKEDTLVEFLSLMEVVNFREVSSDRSDEYDIALIEGSISRDDEVERLKKIRENASLLVALGTCACFGGVNHHKNRFPKEELIQEVYGDHPKETDRVRRVEEVVPVDLSIPGCPVNKDEVERIVVSIVTGREIKLPKYPVCVECKQKINTCLFELGQICLGPITRAGCGAVCPTGKLGCLGCRGPAEDANLESFREIARDRGFSAREVQEKLNFYNAFVEAV